MTTIKTLAKALLGLALAATVGVAKADLTQVTYAETPTTLHAEWLLDADAGSWIIHKDGAYWDTNLGASNLGIDFITGHVTSIGLLSANVTHAYAPHPGDAAHGPTYYFTIAALSLGTTAYSTTPFAEMYSHNGTPWLLDWWTDATTWNSPDHYDHYSYYAAGHGNGTVSVYLDAIHPPVPEPETYAMLLAGLGVIGAIARRRKVSAG